MRKLIFAVTAAALSVPTVTTFSAAPAYAQSGYYNGKVWRDSRGRQRCRKKNGTTGWRPITGPITVPCLK